METYPAAYDPDLAVSVKQRLVLNHGEHEFAGVNVAVRRSHRAALPKTTDCAPPPIDGHRGL